MSTRKGPTTHVVVLVHGINTWGHWVHEIEKTLQENGFATISVSYQRYGILRFLLPFSFLHERAVKRVVSEIRHGTDRLTQRPKYLSVIAHSFGTYVVVRILAQYPEFKWRRIIFCGSVVREDFPLGTYLDRFDRTELDEQYDRPILNEVGTKDFLPALAESITWGYGSVGSHGFKSPSVYSRWHHGLKHSDFLKPKFCQDFWIPFLRKGTLITGERPIPLAWWIRLITRLPLRYVVVFLCLTVITLMGAQPIGCWMVSREIYFTIFDAINWQCS